MKANFSVLLFIVSFLTRSNSLFDFDIDADIVIVGAGPAGCAAAAFLSGMIDPPPSIVMVEKNNEPGGILRGITTVSATWAPKTLDEVFELARRINLADPTQNSSAFTLDELDGILSSSLAAQKLLEELGAVDGWKRKGNGIQPDYYGTTDFFTEYTYYHGPERDLLDQALAFGATYLLPLLGGVAGQNIGKAAPRLDDDLLPVPSFVWRLTQHASSLSNVRILYNTEVTGLVSDSKLRRWKVGTRKYSFEGQSVSADHVIFASGGFTANSKVLKERNLDKMVPHHWNQMNTGIVEKVASDLNFLPCPEVQRKNLPAWYSEAVELNNGKTHTVLFLNGDSLMVVNKQGRRVYNEKWPYSRRGKVCLDEGHLIAVMDRKNLELRTQALWLLPSEQNLYLPDINSGVYIHAASPEQLASKLAHRSLVEPGFMETFVGQLTRYNGYAEAGVDEEFSRHDYIKQQEPQDTPNMSPIDTTDLFALVLLPSALDTCSGPTVDQDSHVLYAEDSSPVPGIYAAGNAACSLTHGFYLAPGIPTFSAFVHAHRAAASIKVEMEG